MAKRTFPMLVAVVLSTTLGCATTFAAYPAPGARYPADSFLRVAERPVSMRDAVNRVRQQTGGRVLDAKDQGTHYRIKVLTPQGEVRIYRVDAQTGEIR